MKQVLTFYSFEQEYYPSCYLDKYHLISEKDAYQNIHFPMSFEELVQARRRMVFDEFFHFLYYLRLNKEYTKKLENEFTMLETAYTMRFLEQLPYQLTNAQKKVWCEIQNDLNSSYCMNRLVQGDVGSGKTIIAILSLLMCVGNGYQGAMMASTEVLALQQ